MTLEVAAVLPSTPIRRAAITVGSGSGSNKQQARPAAVSVEALKLRAGAAVAWDRPCGAWLQEYADWHQQAVQSMSAATAAAPKVKLMMHECPKNALAGCPGIGDRIRGLMETFKWAIMSKRMFLLRWEPTAPLEDVLQPTQIDWRVQPHYEVDSVTDVRRYHWHKGLPRPLDIVNSSFTAFPNHLLSLTHADQDCKNLIPGPDMGCTNAIPPLLRSCVFHALFQPSASLVAFVSDLRKQLFGSAEEPYVAVHLRIGGFEGERKIVRGGLAFGNHSTEEVIANTLTAASNLAAASGIAAPVLVITDNDELRQRLQDGALPGYVSPGYKAKHAATSRDAHHKEALRTSFADLALLAGAHCFIGSPSGFSHTAFMWGRHSCFLMVNGDGNGGVGQKWIFG